MSKQATLTLSHRLVTKWPKPGDERSMPWQESEFTVERITDSVAYIPGHTISKPEVQGLCENAAWKVIIQKPKD